jgi:hypothetical protein
MANFVYNEIKRALFEAEIDLNATDDIRVLLVMTNTTADTEDDKDTISAFTTLDEYDGSGYARQALTGEAVAEDAANDRAEFDGGDATFTTLGAGTRSCQAAIVFKHVTNDTDSVPIAYIDTGGFPFAGNGGDVTIQWNAEGILQQT